ncbi:MAG: DUF6653 family protein [Cyanophyceae cyanobacterium]
MNIFAQAEHLMSMNDKTWKRHASPWSVWTRFLTTTPLISLAVWSRVWLGWYSLLPIGLSFLWTWYNPRAFPPPKSTNNWGSKATFGERIFLDRKVEIPSHHLRAANILTIMSLVGALIWFYGLYALNVWAVVAGIIGAVLPKAWFCDRMVWIYEDMKNADPVYSSWLR